MYFSSFNEKVITTQPKYSIHCQQLTNMTSESDLTTKVGGVLRGPCLNVRYSAVLSQAVLVENLDTRRLIFFSLYLNLKVILTIFFFIVANYQIFESQRFKHTGTEKKKINKKQDTVTFINQ